MSLTVQLSDTDIAQAKLLSHLSNRPSKVQGDVFIWNGHLIDRAVAIVALLKVSNQVPVSDKVKQRMHYNYQQKFKHYSESEDLVSGFDEEPDIAARKWFNAICRIIKQSAEDLPISTVKQILLDLHRN